ncbi:MAG: hypothetical protein NTY30_01430 [Candidatus Berkelbacteria bacterium]|nr:hypothetical protein [Candidatus Berkelbacteria bacterium]
MADQLHLKTALGTFTPVTPGSNAELLLDWCKGNLSDASKAAQAIGHLHIFWVCDADPTKLAMFLSNTNFANIVPANPTLEPA